MSQTAVVDAWLAPWVESESSLPGQDIPWLRDMRAAAKARLQDLGFPTSRWESWRYTNLKPLRSSTFAPTVEEPVPAAREVEAALARLPGGRNLHRLVFVDGILVPPLCAIREPDVRVLITALRHQAQHTRPEMVREHLGRYALYEDNPLTALNTAFWRDGYGIHVPSGMHIEDPIALVFLTTSNGVGRASCLRNLVVAEPGSSVKLIEVFNGTEAGPYFTSVVTEIVAREGSSVELVRLQEEGHEGLHVSDTKVHQEARSKVESHLVTIGARMSRNDLGFRLDAPGAEATLNGLFVLNGQQTTDNQTMVDHASPDCRSGEFYKGVLDGRSRGAFTGRVLVRQDAQHTDAAQTNNNLLLSDHAEIATRPQLEIYADDVKCSHGATSGQLDRDALFYLRSRGIGVARAKQILTRAFASEIINRIGIEAVREHLHPVIDDRLCPGHLLEEVS